MIRRGDEGGFGFAEFIQPGDPLIDEHMNEEEVESVVRIDALTRAVAIHIPGTNTLLAERVCVYNDMPATAHSPRVRVELQRLGIGLWKRLVQQQRFIVRLGQVQWFGDVVLRQQVGKRERVEFERVWRHGDVLDLIFKWLTGSIHSDLVHIGTGQVRYHAPFPLGARARGLFQQKVGGRHGAQEPRP